MSLRGATLAALALIGGYAVYTALAPPATSPVAPSASPSAAPGVEVWPTPTTRAKTSPKPNAKRPATPAVSARPAPPVRAPTQNETRDVAHGEGGEQGDGAVADAQRADDDVPPPPSIDKEEIQLAVREAGPAITHCYQQGLDAGERFGGTLRVQFTLVKADGEGKIADASILDEGLGRPFFEMCVLTALGKASFPLPEGEGKVTVNYPFRLSAGP